MAPNSRGSSATLEYRKEDGSISKLNKIHEEFIMKNKCDAGPNIIVALRRFKSRGNRLIIIKEPKEDQQLKQAWVCKGFIQTYLNNF